MAAKDGTTQKWAAKFRELMDWFLDLERVDGGNLDTAHVKGLAANYLAVKLGLFDRAKAIETLAPLDREPPYRHGDWECDHPELSGYEQIRQWRSERMTHWKRKAEEHARFKRASPQKAVTEDNIRRYCDCLKSIMYQKMGGSWQADITGFAFEANALAVKLGLTHPDWILAMELGLLPFSEAPVIRSLPLPWRHDKPSIIFQNVPVTVGRMGNATLTDLEAAIKKAQSLSPDKATDEHATPPLRKLKDPVKCAVVGSVLHKRSDNIARSLKSHNYIVILDAGASYCDAEDAAVLWPKWKRYLADKKIRNAL